MRYLSLSALGLAVAALGFYVADLESCAWGCMVAGLVLVIVHRRWSDSQKRRE